MKHMRKVFALALTLIMALALTVPAFAAQINVAGAVEGQTYNAYKIFDVTATGTYGEEGTGYAYKITSTDEWFPVVVAYIDSAANQETGVYSGKGLTLTPTTTANVYNVAANDTFNAADFAAYLDGHKSGKTISGTATASKVDGKVTATIGVAVAGYYFIDSNLGALCSLQTSNAVVNMVEKNSVPSLDKKIVTATGDVTETTASIGDTVEYKITVTDGIGTDDAITVHDVMEDGLTLNKSSIKVNGVAISEVSGATISYPAELAGDDDDCTFEIVFSADYVKNLADTATITITYSAELDSDAEIDTATNDNTAWLTYSAQEPTHITVKVHTYMFDLIKTKEDGTELAGAEFKLYDAVTGGNEIKLVKVSDTEYRVADTDEQVNDGATIIAGKVVIKGLGNGTYYLEETKAPDGYNKLTERKALTIADANLIATENKTDDVPNGTYTGGVQVINQTGSLLPSTGGIGTTIFYMVGGILMAGAAILLITKKKMSNEQ